MSRAETAAPQGIIEMAPRRAFLQKSLVLALTVGPFAGLVLAIASLWGDGVTPLHLAIAGVFYVASGLGITVGYHRLLTHRSFEAPGWLRATFAVLGSLAIEGSVIDWVADHRRHHAYADRAGDPHSPHLEEGEGLGATLRGLWHAHLGWLFVSETTDAQRWAPDLVRDPVMRRIDRAFPLLVVASLTVPAMIGGLLTASWAGALGGFVWGSLVRVFLLHHVTWSVNSICHFFGRRPYQTTDHSTNNWPLALISFGESWHNTHHAFPTSAVHGLGRGQLDPSGWIIRMLERLGVARDVKVPDTNQLESKRAR